MKKIGSISLDLDNQWSYMKTHGDPGWEQYPSYLDQAVPRILDILDEYELRITFFIVGQDAALERNHGALRRIAERGHDVGNHSYRHEPWLHLYPREQIQQEIRWTHELLLDVTGRRPTGFRGPGYSWSRDLLLVLAEEGYTYDASSLPTFIGPIARAYYFRSVTCSREEREQRRLLFGRFSDGFRPLRPFLWQLEGDRSLLEIPVTTMPLFRIPFHLSYLLYLYRISEKLMMVYLEGALRLCRLTGTEPSLLLHPLDFLGGDDLDSLKFFPGMDLPGEAKRACFGRVIRRVLSEFRLLSLDDYAARLSSTHHLKEVSGARTF